MDKTCHWESVYSSKSHDAVSWFQFRPDVSLKIIQNLGLSLSSAVIDVGGGASCLVDCLVGLGYSDLTVLDISKTALTIAQQRLKGTNINWWVSDMLSAQLPKNHFGVWHDRAVFHFLTDSSDRQRYQEKLTNSLQKQGFFIVSTFSKNGPEQCSGLDVVRYDLESLEAEFGANFRLLHGESELHLTPSTKTQSFIYGCFQKK